MIVIFTDKTTDMNKLSWYIFLLINRVDLANNNIAVYDIYSDVMKSYMPFSTDVLSC